MKIKERMLVLLAMYFKDGFTRKEACDIYGVARAIHFLGPAREEQARRRAAIGVKSPYTESVLIEPSPSDPCVFEFIDLYPREWLEERRQAGWFLDIDGYAYEFKGTKVYKAAIFEGKIQGDRREEDFYSVRGDRQTVFKTLKSISEVVGKKGRAELLKLNDEGIKQAADLANGRMINGRLVTELTLHTMPEEIQVAWDLALDPTRGVVA